jgi:hypothetical protein
MNNQRVESIVQLIETFPAAEQTMVVNRLIERRGQVEHSIADLERRLQIFEAQYGMPSSDFYRRFQAGELGDTAAFFEWNTYYEMIEEASSQAA